MNKNILVVAAHPDDEVLGCGGTIARLAGEGYRVEVLILGEGITSRDKSRGDGQERKLLSLKRDSRAANRVLKVHTVTFYDFPDNKFDSVPLLDIVKTVEKVKRSINPGIVFTHYGYDLNVDHRITFQAVLTATRPMGKEPVKDIYAFETLSSTEWGFHRSFDPDCFFDISATIKTKLRAMSEYTGELEKFPHPRSLRGIEINAAYRGMQSGSRFAEAFRLIRMRK